MTLYNNVLEAIGHTPLVKLNKVGKNLPVNFYAKFEAMNPGGSVKDRIAVSMIDDAERKGKLKPGGTIIEATAGNTGVGLALVAAVRGYRCIFVMPDKMSTEKVNLLKAMGAEVLMTETEVPLDDPRYYMNLAVKLTQEMPGAFCPSQFKNPTNPQVHYQSTGPEIWQDLKGKVDAFVAGVGTGGCVSGVGKYLKEKNNKVKIVLADPVGSTLAGGEVGSYKVEGIGQNHFPETYEKELVDAFVKVSDKDSFLLARRITCEEGMLVGGSSGTHMAAALEFAKQMPAQSNIVVLFPDTGRNYLGKIFNDAWMKSEGFIT